MVFNGCVAVTYYSYEIVLMLIVEVLVVSKAKLFTQLDDLQALLKETALAHFRSAINNNNEFVFCVSDFATGRDLKQNVDKQTEELVALGRQVLVLKEKLGECSKGSVAERICCYCRKWSDPKTRLSGVQLAQQFIEEIYSA